MSLVLHFKYRNETCKLTDTSEDLALLNTGETPQHTWNRHTSKWLWARPRSSYRLWTTLTTKLAIKPVLGQTSSSTSSSCCLCSVSGLDPELHQIWFRGTSSHMVSATTGWFLHPSYLLIKTTHKQATTPLFPDNEEIPYSTGFCACMLWQQGDTEKTASPAGQGHHATGFGKYAGKTFALLVNWAAFLPPPHLHHFFFFFFFLVF